MTEERIRTIIADDEPEARASLRVLLEADPGIDLVAHCCSGEQLARAIQRFEPDLLLVDIQMPGLSGLDAVKQLPHRQRPAVVFVTAHERFAAEAFDVAAVDYLLKPYTDARFSLAMVRAKAAIRHAAVDRLQAEAAELATRASRLAGRPMAAQPRHIAMLPVRSGKRLVLVPVDEIDWIQAEADYVRVHTKGKSHLVRATMNGIERRLDPDRFVRVHRSTITNISAIAEVRQGAKDDYAVVLKDGTIRQMSERGRANFARLINAQW